MIRYGAAATKLVDWDHRRVLDWVISGARVGLHERVSISSYALGVSIEHHLRCERTCNRHVLLQ